MRSLLDVNVLLALFQSSHSRHEHTHRWWAMNRLNGWASCPLTQNGFVRIASQPKYAKPVSISEAMRGLQESIAQPEHAFWPDDISLLDPQLVDAKRILGPRQLTDIYLLALAVKYRGRLATLDESIPIAAVRGAAAKHVVVI